MSEAFKPHIDVQKLPFRHPLRQRRELLMMSVRLREFSSALLGVRVMRVVLPYVSFLVGCFFAWNGAAELGGFHIMLAFTGLWIFADVLVRGIDRHFKTVEAELETLDREIEAEIDRLATAGVSGQ